MENALSALVNLKF